MMRLVRGERQYLHYPFWGLDGSTPEIKVGTGDWQPMTLASGYTPPATWAAPSGVSGSPTWYRTLLATPEAAGNPVGTIVITESRSPLRIRVTAGDEIDILPDRMEWIELT